MVLEFFVKDRVNYDQRGEAINLFELMQSFHFLFYIFVILKESILIITRYVIKFQRKDQNIVNAINEEW